jgi:acetyltransferase-like isoleucine patch superfamily enzyme
MHKGVKICQGGGIIVGPNAKLEFDEYSGMGDSALVVCMKSIYVGKYSEITWDSQVLDYGTHKVKYSDGSVSDLCKEVIIGDHCWICNRTSIMPGTKLPSYTIIASNSLLNKDYTKIIDSYSMLAGQPAKLVRTNVIRVYKEERSN